MKIAHIFTKLEASMNESILNSIRETKNLAELQMVVKGFGKDAKKNHLTEITKQAILLAKRDAKINLVEARNRFKSINDLLPSVTRSHGIIGSIAARIFPSRERTLHQLDKQIAKSQMIKPKLYQKLEKLHPDIEMSHEAEAHGLPPLLFAKKMKFLTELQPHGQHIKSTRSLVHQIERMEGPLTAQQIMDVKRNLVLVLDGLGMTNQALSWESLETKIRNVKQYASLQAEAMASMELLKAAEPKSKGFVPLTRQELESVIKEEIRLKNLMPNAESLPIVFDREKKRIQDMRSNVFLKALLEHFHQAKESLPMKGARAIGTIHALMNYRPSKIEEQLDDLKAWSEASTLAERIQILIEGSASNPSSLIVAFIQPEAEDLEKRLEVIGGIVDALFEMGYSDEAFRIFTSTKAIVKEWNEATLSQDFRNFLAVQRARRE
jgi:hypothetical protein